MHKVTALWFILPFLCCVLGQKKHISKRVGGYDAHSKEEGSHYESNHYEYEHKPYPYRFGYDIKDEKGNLQYHKEEGDEYNVKKGSYGYTDAYGVYRHVDYIADHLGFRAKIRTNEPGTARYHPAHVTIYSEPPPSHIHANYEKYNSNHVDYHQQEHESYDNSGHEEYEKSAHQSYEEPAHRDLVKSEHPGAPSHLQQQQQDHEESHQVKLDHQKFSYVPVYVSNNIEYKD